MVLWPVLFVVVFLSRNLMLKKAGSLMPMLRSSYLLCLSWQAGVNHAHMRDSAILPMRSFMHDLVMLFPNQEWENNGLIAFLKSTQIAYIFTSLVLWMMCVHELSMHLRMMHGLILLRRCSCMGMMETLLLQSALGEWTRLVFSL